MCDLHVGLAKKTCRGNALVVSVAVAYLADCTVGMGQGMGIGCDALHDDSYNTQRTKALGASVTGPRPRAFFFPCFVFARAPLLTRYNN